jgi:hypothetical protein
VQLAPDDSGIEPFIIQAPVGGGQVGKVGTGTGGLVLSGAVTNILQRSKICARSAGGHPSGDPVDEPDTGDGTIAVDCSTTTYVDGTNSLKIARTGTTSSGTITSTCITTGIGADLYASIWAKKTGGTTTATWRLDEYDGADCTTLLASNTMGLSAADLTTTWTKYGAKLAAATWNADTSSYNLVIFEGNADAVSTATSYFDAPMVYAGADDMAIFCGSDAAATTACTANYGAITTPMNAGDWTITGTTRLPMAQPATDRYVFYVAGTSGNNNGVGLYFDGATDDKIFYVYDSDGAIKTATISDAITANTDYAWKVWHRRTGEIGFTFGAWSGTLAGAGTGAMSGISTTTYLGHATGDGAGYLKDLKVYKRVKL